MVKFGDTLNGKLFRRGVGRTTKLHMSTAYTLRPRRQEEPSNTDAGGYAYELVLWILVAVGMLISRWLSFLIITITTRALNAHHFEALYERICKIPVIWTEVGESQLIGPEIVQETIEKIIQIKERLKTVRSRQKSYADKRQRKDWATTICETELEIVESKLETECYLRRLIAEVYPEEQSCINYTFHLSNLNRMIPLRSSETGCEKAKAKKKSISQNFCWNSQAKEAEFTWELEEPIQPKKYLIIISNPYHRQVSLL
ncbi:hypothetical protein Tco_0488865 [Tanacetum coccineum]